MYRVLDKSLTPGMTKVVPRVTLATPVAKNSQKMGSLNMYRVLIKRWTPSIALY